VQGLHAETSVLDATATRVRGREALSLPPLALVGPLFLLVVATALWLVSLRSVEISRMNDLGLISVLRPPTMIAFLLLTASFCGTVCQRQVRGPLVLAHLVILVGMLYGTTTLVEHTMHLSTAYRHVGLTEYIVRHGRVDPTFETYFNWPGFFIAAAFFTRVAGFHSALSLTPWSSALFNLLYLGPIIMIFRASTDNQRHVWLGAWFFFVTNWPRLFSSISSSLPSFSHGSRPHVRSEACRRDGGRAPSPGDSRASRRMETRRRARQAREGSGQRW